MFVLKSVNYFCAKWGTDENDKGDPGSIIAPANNHGHNIVFGITFGI